MLENHLASGDGIDSPPLRRCALCGQPLSGQPLPLCPRCRQEAILALLHPSPKPGRRFPS